MTGDKKVTKIGLEAIYNKIDEDLSQNMLKVSGV